MDSFKSIILPIIVVFSILFLSTTALAATSLNVSVIPAVQSNHSANLANTNITVFGSIANTSVNDVIKGINVTASVGSNWNYQVTGAGGLFNFNVTAPTAVGEYTLTVTNNGSLPTKTFTVYVSNSTPRTSGGEPSGLISYIGKFPPFTNGTTFAVNITLFNGTSPLTSYQPSVQIYQANGQNVSWTVANLSATTNATGSIAFNITVPATAAAGEYAISVDRGAAFTIFRAGLSFQIAVNTRTAADEVTSNFAPGSSVDILAKIRTSSGNPVTGATVSAIITYPNGTTTKNISLSAHPTSEGFYNSSFTDTNARGKYQVKVGAIVSGNEVFGSTIFTTQTFESRFEPIKTFFFEWGGQSAFKPGQSIAFDIVSINLTDGSVINWSDCTGGNYTFVGVAFVNGTNTTLGNGSMTLSTDTYLPGTTVCKVQFTGPSTAGVYNIKYNVTVASDTLAVEGFFSVQNHFLQVTPVLDVGGFEGFHQVFSPGTNITLQLKAVNVTTNTKVQEVNITGHTVTRIVPLEFTGSASEVTTLNQTSFNGVNNTVPPNITLTLPTSIIGPLLIDVRATVSSRMAGTSSLSEVVTGNTFIISNYLNGFLGPQSTSGGPSHEGMGAGGFSADAQCSGTQAFSGTVFDTNTSTAAQGATVVGIIQAREESTGKDVSSFLSIVNTSSSDSNGLLKINVTFSPSGGYSFSGSYFAVFNATYKGKYAGVPTFFMCRTLNIGFPLIKALGSDQQFSWQVSPTSALNITLTNVANMSGTLVGNSSIFMIRQIFNFNPSSGSMQVLRNNTPLQTNFTTLAMSNNASLIIYPQNFTIGSTALTKWPSGFFDLQPRVVANLGTDTGFGGFMVVAFDAFPEFSFGQQYPAGSNQSLVVRAATNVSNFTITMGRPWEGVLETAGNVSARLISDGWNGTTDTGNFSSYSINNLGGPYEKWNVSFTVPSTLRKGGAMLTVSVKSNATGIDGESVDVPLFVSITKYSVIIPNEEGVGSTGSSFDDFWIIANGMYPLTFNTQEAESGRNASRHGWNLTWINTAYNINSTSGRVCVKDGFNSTRFTSGNPVMLINGSGNTTHFNRILVLDSITPGVYDTIIFNRTNETVILNTTTGRSIGGSLYLWTIKDCSYFTIVNVSSQALQGQGGGYVSNTWGGSNQVSQNFTIPYVIISGNAPVSGTPVSIKSVAKQDNRGFGFEGKLSTNSYTVTGANTNADGIAFVTLNVSVSGRMMAFWSTTIGTETDSADMSTATFFEVKGFSTSSQSITPLSSGVVTLVNDSSNRTGLVGASPNNRIFNGTATETIDGDFVANAGVVDTWNVIYNASSNRTRIVNATAATVVYADAQQSNYNGSLDVSVYTPNGVTALSNPKLKIGEWNNGTAANSFAKTVVLYTDTSGSSFYTAFTATQNITALICAQGFEKPTPKPVENATINVSVTDWSSFPSSVKYLDIFKVSDGSKGSSSNPILTSPSGCAVVTIGPGQLSSWPSASAGRPPVFIEGTITNVAGQSEFVYVGDVFRP